MKKSKTLYMLVLMLLIGISLIDHLWISKESPVVVVGPPEAQSNPHFLFAFLSNNH